MSAPAVSAPALFRGQWLEPDDPDYESARLAFNRRGDARPPVIARCLGVSDVVAAVSHARERGLRIDIRSAGLSLAAPNTDDRMLIDLGLMRAVQVFPESRTARIQGGTRAGDLQLEAGLHGLGAVTGGLSSTGVGLILDAGLGHLGPRAGYATDNILSLELVTAVGEVVVASADQNEDLFWAARGTSGNFGVVTALEVRLHEVPPLVHAGSIRWSLDNLGRGLDVLRASWEWDESLSIIAYLSGLSFDGRGGLEALACHSGWAAEADVAFQRLRDVGAPDEEDVAPIRFADLHFLNDDLFPPMRGATHTHVVEGLSNDMVEALVEKIREPAGEGGRLIELVALRGGLGRAPEFPSAFRNRAHESSWWVAPGCWWEKPSEDQMHERWVEETAATIERVGPTIPDRRDPSTVGAVLDEDGVARMYGDRFDRLRALKREWDPDNTFAGGCNIPPA